MEVSGFRSSRVLPIKLRQNTCTYVKKRVNVIINFVLIIRRHILKLTSQSF